MIGIVRHEMKWYSRNNRRLWCFKAAKVEAVHVFISSGLFSRVGGTSRLHTGLVTRKGGTDNGQAGRRLENREVFPPSRY